MPDPTPGIGPSLDDVVRRAAAAPIRADRLRLYDAALRRAKSPDDRTAALRALAAAGPRFALEFAARMPEPIPPATVPPLTRMLDDRANPVAVRLAVAGKLLASVPDSPAAVGPVLKAVTAGLSRSRKLQRLIELQSRVEKCRTLDTMVSATEAGVKLKCPKCPAKLPRGEFIKHLWHEHRLAFDRGAARNPLGEVEVAVTAAAAPAGDAGPVFGLTPLHFPQSTATQVLQAVAARQRAGGTAVPDVLTRSAAEQSAGLCPACLNPVPDPIPPLPPPLAVGGGRMSGDGFVVDVRDTAAGRRVTVATPGATWIEAASGRRFPPRLFGVLLAAPCLLACVVALAVLPAAWLFAPPPILAGLLAVLVGGVYALARWLRKPLPDANDVAADVAWAALVPTLGRSRTEARWLTRLCRASVGRGTPEDRVPRVWELIEHGAVLADKGGVYLQLLAAARALQACDGAAMGKEKVSAQSAVFDPWFQKELPAGYAEAVAELLTSDDLLADGDRLRLGVLLTAAAFVAGFGPRDFHRVLRFLPHLRVLLGQPTADALAAVYVVWRGRDTEPWTTVGPAVTVFELARASPSASRKLLAAHPDALLRVELPDAAEREFGEAVLTARGLVVAGKVLTDPDGEVEVSRSPRGSGWIMALGAHRIPLDRKVSAAVGELLVGWLKYRVNRLLPQADRFAEIDAERLEAALQPLVRECPLCGAECVCRTGRVGEPWPLA